MRKNFLDDLGIAPNLLLAGFFGALLLVRKEGKTWKDNLLILITGSFGSAYLTPFVIEMTGVKSTNALPFFGFIVGFGCIRIVDFFMDKYFKQPKKDDTPKL